jgi:hypothetical protein
LTRDEGFLLALRGAAAMCFLGHGAFGVLTKQAWLAYFAVVGIGPDRAYSLMPLIGLVDILLGLSMLRPTRAALAYMTAWAAWTALLRPLAGQGLAECLERAGNCGVPLALLLTALAAGSRGGWFARLSAPPLDGRLLGRVSAVLRLTTVTLLLGHGLLAVAGKPLLAKHLTALGVAAWGAPVPAVLSAQGWFEIGLGAAVLAFPSWPLLCLVLAWKLGTELLFPLTGDSIWEFIERGGSYGAPLALLILARSAPRSERLGLVSPASA